MGRGLCARTAGHSALWQGNAESGVRGRNRQQPAAPWASGLLMEAEISRAISLKGEGSAYGQPEPAMATGLMLQSR